MMSGQKPVLSVVIPCFNVGDFLSAQLNALAEQKCTFPWELVIVDNNSTDDTVEVARQLSGKFPLFKIVTEKKKGRHHACNTGAHSASGHSIVFVDGDDIVSEGFLEAMFVALQDNPIVAGRLDHTLLNSGESVEVGLVQTDGLMEGFGFLPYAVGAVFGITKKIFDEVGGFQDKPFCEDADLSWRLQLAGHKIVFAGKAVVHYRQRASHKKMFLQHKNFGEAHVLLYRDYKKHGMPRRSFKDVMSEWLFFLPSGIRIKNASEKTRWIRRYARCIGHLTGSFKYRVFYP